MMIKARIGMVLVILKKKIKKYLIADNPKYSCLQPWMRAQKATSSVSLISSLRMSKYQNI